MKPLSVLSLFFLIIVSCKKDAAPPNNNLVKATITLKGRSPRSITMTNLAGFSRAYDDIRGDTLYNIVGGDSIGTIEIVLINKYPPGTYEFFHYDTLGNNISFASYEESEGWWGPTLYYSTLGIDSRRNALSPGTFTITRMTDSEVEGSMNVVFIDGNEEVGRLENVYFKGTFLE